MSVLCTDLRFVSICVFTMGFTAALAETSPGGPPATSGRTSAVAQANSNGYLTPALPAWWRLSFEIRGRAESYQGISGVAGFGDGYYMHRLRVNSTFTVRPWLRVFAQFQDSRVGDYDRSPLPWTIRNPLDLRQAYVDVGVGGDQAWTVRFGRQALVFGDMRLVSTSNWSNVGPSYDGLRLTYARGKVRLDWFGVQVVQPRQGFDRPCPDRRLAGFYGSFTAGKAERVIDAYLIWKGNRRAVSETLRPGGLDVYTAGFRSTGGLTGSFDYNMELALQRGHIATDDLAAWLGHFEVGRKQRLGRGDLRFWLEHNYASGDRDPLDGRRQTFEQYYPSPWAVVARAAEFASRNLHEPLAGMQWQATPKWRFRSTLRGFWLASRQDALYLLSGAVYARRPESPSRRAGEELGIWAIHELRKNLQLWGGYGRLFPGPLLKDAGKGKPTNYLFLVWTLTFD